MSQQPVRIDYRFDYNAKLNVIQFSIKIGNAPVLLIGLDADSFFTLGDKIVSTGKPFLEEIKRRRAEGFKEDMNVKFNTEAWEKKMEGKDEK